MTDYEVPAAAVEHELTVKGSRFIACVERVVGVAERADFMTRVQQQYAQASHYCTAFVGGAPAYSQLYAMSDDGEPSGTAGKPMLQVLLGHDLGEVGVVVVRYFGGVKLGTGGLQRAYSQAVADALRELPRQRKIHRVQAQLSAAYSDQAAVEYALGQADAEVVASQYLADIQLTVAVPSQKLAALQQLLTAQTQGRVALQVNGD